MNSSLAYLRLSLFLFLGLFFGCSSEEFIDAHDRPGPAESGNDLVMNGPKEDEEKVPPAGADHAPNPDVSPLPGTGGPVPPPAPPPPVPVTIVIECGDNLQDPLEECEDGNKESGDGCSKECKKEFCGDNRVNNNDENCDDGNKQSGDGCDEDCHTEFTFVSSARSSLDVGFTQSCFKSEKLWQLKCWGSNNQGELGQENTEFIGNGVGASVKESDPVRFGSSVSAALVSAGGVIGSRFTCVVTSAGTLKCFGDNSAGQLGKGNKIDIGDNQEEMGNDLKAIQLGNGRRVRDADAGGKHVCAILDNASVKCFGKNTYGQLGLGHTNDIGDNPGEMGDNLSALELGSGRTALHIAAGEDFSCAVLNSGFLKCWGRNDSGQLGQSSTNSLGDNANEMGDNLLAIDLGAGRTAQEVAVGARHTCVLLDDSSVKCFGNNAFGQLGQGNTNNLGDEPAELGNALLPIDLGTGRTAQQIAAANNFSCVLLDNGDVKCFGENNAGQLGQGNIDAIGDAAGEMGDNLSPINLGAGRTATAIAAGGNTICALLDNEELKCFGENGSGQLGQNSTDDIGDNPNEMGANLLPIALEF